MDSQLRNTLEAFSRVGEGHPSCLREFIDNLPEPHDLLSPWETWTLLGFTRHHSRQAWVKEIVDNQLRGDSGYIADRGAFGHPDEIAQAGSVPGMPEWEYYFHGRGCLLKHKVYGEAIDVDFYDDTADYFNSYFYQKYLESPRSPGSVELRLCELHNSKRPLRIAEQRLVAVGAFEPFAQRQSSAFRIAPELASSLSDMETFCDHWESAEQRLWLAMLIADWPFVQSQSNIEDDIHEAVRRRSELCLQKRSDQLRKQTGYTAADALFGLAEIDAADEAITEALQSPPSALVSAAVEIVSDRDDQRWCPQIYTLFSRLSSSGQSPEPHIWMKCLKFLIRHNHHKEKTIASLPQAGGYMIGEAVLLALEEAPEYALPLIRKALLSDVPMNRIEVAAILALIAKPWAKRELLRVLEESDQQEATADVRAALLELSDLEAEQAVLDWEQLNPHEDEPGTYIEVDGRRLGPFYSMTEHSLKERGARIRFEMTQLHDRVMKIRHVVPT